MRLGVSPAASSTPTGVCSQRFEPLFPGWNPGLRCLSCSPVVPPGLSVCGCGTACSTSCCLACLVFQPPPCRESSPPLLPVWVNVSSLTPWLSDFHTVQFSGSSGCFLLLNLLLSCFWLFEEAQCVHLCLHLDWKSLFSF